MTHEDSQRTLGFLSATGVGVGAIVGGGILALAGAAFAETGPAAIAAFAINGVIAMLTALSMAEMASKFPQSGGTYNFSRKVMSVEAAFTVGWVVWFASIVAAVLYAIGFAHFAIILVRDVAAWLDADLTWVTSSAGRVGLTGESGVAIATTVGLVGLLALRSGGGGAWINVAKVVVFAVLIAGGFVAIARQPVEETVGSLRPFLASGWSGLFSAMGYSFIALQGFDLIAAVGGEVRRPEKNIPRAMVTALAIALLIYLPLLLVITTVGTGGVAVGEAAAADPEGIVAIAAGQFLGRAGYALVIVAAVLSMFSALQANLFAASRIAMAMAADRTLPTGISRLHPRTGTPVAAVGVTGLLICLLIWMLPDVAAAGAASSLIFLITFAIAHWIAVLVRQRSENNPPPFRTWAFPAVPIVGGVSCLALAIFQGISVPAAGSIAVIWLSIGGLLFLTLFARRARVMDVSNVAANPELVRLRGHAPLMLVPVANPGNADALLSLASTLVPAGVGRVMLQTVIVADDDWDPDEDPAPASASTAVLRQALGASRRLGIRPEVLTTLAANPMAEIARVARLHRCESVLLGLSRIAENAAAAPLERLLSDVDGDVIVLRAGTDWMLAQTESILVPVAGRGGHDHLLARLLGSLSRTQKHSVHFLRVLPRSTPDAVVRRARRDLRRMAFDNTGASCETEIVLSNDAIDVVTRRSADHGLLILGVQRIDKNQKLFGRFTRAVAAGTATPLIVMSRRG